MIDEFSLIDFLKEEFNGGEKIIGDDCAVFNNFLISLDQMVEDVHFKFSKIPPIFLGKRVVNSTLSDIAAMGGDPVLFFLGLVLRESLPFSWLEEFFRGVKEVLKKYNVILAGGDLSNGEKISISATVIGKVTGKNVLMRKGAKLGDLVLCTLGDGCAKIGMEKVYKNGISEKILSDADVMKFLAPEPLIDIGKFLVNIGVVNCCIDISDGILRDLKNLCRESNLSASLFLDEIEKISDYKEITRDDFLKSGEEYELLFSIGEKDLPFFLERFREKFPHRKVAVIGKFVKKKENFLYFLNKNGKYIEVSDDGYDHFGGTK